MALHLKQLVELVKTHGAITGYSFREGGQWNACFIAAPEHAALGILVLHEAHALRFGSGREWDEVNGMRPLES